MKIFICNKILEIEESDKAVDELLALSEYSIAVLRETEHSDDWQNNVKKKLEKVDFVVFLLGENTFDSEAIKWELNQSKLLNKIIVGVKLSNASSISCCHLQDFHVFENTKQCYAYLMNTYESDRQLLIEQYKLMVSSTEKVTEQRLKVNNLFFTVTSSVLSLALVFGKTLEYSVAGSIGMLVLTVLAFLVSFFWEKLIRSYGKLNEGKFQIIDSIEKQLGTDMFEREWKILIDNIGYESNTETEATIIKNFRRFIVLVGVMEITFFLYKSNMICFGCTNIFRVINNLT